MRRAGVPAIRSEAIKQGYIIENAKSPRYVFWWCDETGSLECTSNWHGQTGSFSHCFSPIQTYLRQGFLLFSHKWKQKGGKPIGRDGSFLRLCTSVNHRERVCSFFSSLVGGDFYFGLFPPLVSSSHRRQTQSPVGHYKVFSCLLFSTASLRFRKGKKEFRADSSLNIFQPMWWLRTIHHLLVFI